MGQSVRLLKRIIRYSPYLALINIIAGYVGDGFHDSLISYAHRFKSCSCSPLLFWRNIERKDVMIFGKNHKK